MKNTKYEKTTNMQSNCDRSWTSVNHGSNTREEWRLGINPKKILSVLNNSKEEQSIVLERTYQALLSRLRGKFPVIPEDLTNKYIEIIYEKGKWSYCSVSLYNNNILYKNKIRNVIRLSKITKEWDLWIGKSEGEKREKYTNKYGMGYKKMKIGQIFNLKKFESEVENIINHSNECEIRVNDKKQLYKPRPTANKYYV